MGRANRRATVSMPAADRLFRQSGNVGEHRSAFESAELCSGTCRQQDARSAYRRGFVAGRGLVGRSESGTGPRGASISWRASRPTTVETLEKQLDNPQVLQAKLDDARKQVDLGVVAGLVLGAPEFQRR